MRSCIFLIIGSIFFNLTIGMLALSTAYALTNKNSFSDKEFLEAFLLSGFIYLGGFIFVMSIHHTHKKEDIK